MHASNGHDPRTEIDFQALADLLAGHPGAGYRGRNHRAAVALLLAVANGTEPRRAALVRRNHGREANAAWFADFCRLANTIPRRDMDRPLVFADYIVRFPNGGLIEVIWHGEQPN